MSGLTRPQPVEATPSVSPTMSERKRRIYDAVERLAPELEDWRQRNRYFHEEDARYLRFLIRPGIRVLELGCGNGDLLANLTPAEGVGIDFSPAMIALARHRHPEQTFVLGDVEDPETIRALGPRPFDVILLSDTIGSLEDIQRSFELLHPLCTTETRIVVSYYSRLWEPALRFAERIGLKMPTQTQNWLSTDDISAILALADFEQIKQEWRQLLPKRWGGLGPLINRFVGTLPLLRRLSVRNYLVLRSRRVLQPTQPSLSVIVPCRNERGNIEAAVQRLPQIAPVQEIIFIEGHSQDGTFDEVKRVIAAYPHLRIRGAVQDGKGKGDAVRKGFDMAEGDLLMILDADLTMPPEDMGKYYDVLASGKGEFVNGSRLVYPMEDEAMRFLNLIANRVFAILFSYLLNQRFTDTLCGTKALSRVHYQQLVAGRSYFGNFDPFGDFDLIFGAAKLNLKSIEVPIRYMARTYGETQISRFRHGLLLLRMVMFAWWKLKAI
ncbi:MAG TPA: bifunctional class I SAM-dependent methyltransferase/glycosyltransferase family 2 protein [Aliidongia sp.]|nr:bifunctional class I SAM-dependent methyltransferase/glycosyltransferase family 2 protein [Aliidongia sp.]